MNRNRCAVLMYAAVHFAVDFSCAYLMFSWVFQSEKWQVAALIYNFCAFALQMPIGLLADKVNRNGLCAAVGCLLVAIAFFLPDIPVSASVVCGLGNAMFHVGGGIDVLNLSSERCGALGVFVSPGALGIYFGTLLGKTGDVPALAALVLSAVGIFVAVAAGKVLTGSLKSANTTFLTDDIASPTILIPVVCFMAVVCIRSYGGMVADFPWKGNGMWALAVVSATVAGKTAGGFLADTFGSLRTSVFSMTAAAFLFMLPSYPLAGVMAVFLFNMTMPVTLFATVRMMPGAKGFSFGLLTFGLFLGFLPVYMGWIFSNLLPVTCIVSAVLMAWGLKRGEIV